MLSNILFRGTAAFGGAPFRLKKCTALTSGVGGAAAGSAAGGVPGALVGGALGVASSLLGGKDRCQQDWWLGKVEDFLGTNAKESDRKA